MTRGSNSSVAFLFYFLFQWKLFSPPYVQQSSLSSLPKYERFVKPLHLL